MMKDWICFLITILILNFISFTYLVLFLGNDIDYVHQMVNILFTFLLYLFFSYLFSIFDNIILGKFN